MLNRDVFRVTNVTLNDFLSFFTLQVKTNLKTLQSKQKKMDLLKKNLSLMFGYLIRYRLHRWLFAMKQNYFDFSEQHKVMRFSQHCYSPDSAAWCSQHCQHPEVNMEFSPRGAQRGLAHFCSQNPAEATALNWCARGGKRICFSLSWPTQVTVSACSLRGFGQQP